MRSAADRNLRPLATAAGKLKDVRRQGWVDRGVVDAESVADHSYRLALLAWAVARGRGLDTERAVLIALLHDLAEAEVGDETPFDEVLRAARERDDRGPDPALFERAAPVDAARRAAKRRREGEAMARLAENLPPALGEEVVALWEDYAAGGSPEARLVKELDRIETLSQAEAYAARQPGVPIGSFRTEVDRGRLPADLAGLL